MIIRLLIVLTAAVSLAAAQRSDLRGTVADSANGEKLPFATVSIAELKRGTVTTASGFYLLAGLPYGTYTVTVSALGYQTRTATVRIAGTEPVSKNFVLSSRPIEVSGVDVVGQRSTELSGATVSAHRLGQKDLMQVPVTGQADLFRSIQVLPGVVAGSDVSSKFFVRGGAGDQNLIIYDGLKIYNPFHAFGIFSIFDPDIIKSTEVYTGGFPAGFGGRLSSVINVQSDDGNAARFAGKAGVNLISGKLQLEGPLPGENSWIVNVRRSLLDNGLDRFLTEPPPIEFHDIFAKVRFGGGDYGKYSANFFTARDRISARSAADASHDWNAVAGSLRISDLLQDRAYFESVISYSKFGIDRTASLSGVITPASSTITDMSIRSDFTIFSESQDLYLFGFEVSGLGSEFSYAVGPTRSIAQKLTAAEFWSWFRYQTTLGPVALDAGLHTDMLGLLNGLTFSTVFQPRVSGVLTLTDVWKLKASAGSYTQRLLTLTNEDDITSLYEAWYILPKSEEPEKAVHLIAGVEGRPAPDVTLSLQVYRKTYARLSLYNRDKRLSTEPDFVRGTGLAQGVEVMVRWTLSDLDLYSAYTYGRTTVTVGPYSYPPRYDRRHTLNAMATLRILSGLDLTAKWEFGTGYAYTQSSAMYFRRTFDDLGRSPLLNDEGSMYISLGEKNAARLPAFHRLDLTLTYRYAAGPVRGDAGLNLINVYDRKNILYYDRKTAQTVHMLPLMPSAFITAEF